VQDAVVTHLAAVGVDVYVQDAVVTHLAAVGVAVYVQDAVVTHLAAVGVDVYVQDAVVTHLAAVGVHVYVQDAVVVLALLQHRLLYVHMPVISTLLTVMYVFQLTCLQINNQGTVGILISELNFEFRSLVFVLLLHANLSHNGQCGMQMYSYIGVSFRPRQQENHSVNLTKIHQYLVVLLILNY